VQASTFNEGTRTMTGSDARDRLVNGFVSYALARALFENLSGADRMRTAQVALSLLPARPDPLQDPPLHQAWKDAERELKTLGRIE
jgi:hypothetical protein